MIKIITDNTLYEHAILRTQTTGQPFDLWVDEFGKDRKTSHNEPRFKVSANGVELDIVLHSDGNTEIVNNKREIRKFKYAKQAEQYIKKYEKPLLAHWNHVIDTGDLSIILRKTKNNTDELLNLLDKAIKNQLET